MKNILILKFFTKFTVTNANVSKANFKNALLKRKSDGVVFQLILQNALEQLFCRTPADETF